MLQEHTLIVPRMLPVAGNERIVVCVDAQPLSVFLLQRLRACFAGSPNLSQAPLPATSEPLCALLPAAVGLPAICPKVLAACPNSVGYALSPAPETALVLLAKLEIARGSPRRGAREAVLSALVPR
jgi:hypothetical protein